MATQDPLAMLQQLYSQAGVKDAGRGSGFTDQAYWLEHPSEILNGRLGADLAGSGPDQSTGTVWGPNGPPTFTGAGAQPPSGLVPSGQPAGSFPMPGGAPTGTQSDLVRQALLNLGGGTAAGAPPTLGTQTPPSMTMPMGDPTLSQPPPAPDPMAPYQDAVRQQLLSQLGPTKQD
jgi:hypothetical protein